MLIKDRITSKKETMKIIEIKEKPKEKFGRIVANNVVLEVHEYDTLLYLASRGLDIEVTMPVNTPKTNNPDIYMLGVVWEMKSPESSNKKTLKKRFHKASLQASNVVFDLRRVKKDYSIVRTEVLRMFDKNVATRRLIMIEKDGKVLDFRKNK